MCRAARKARASAPLISRSPNSSASPPRQYLAIEPVLREHSVLVNGEAISLIPENAPKVLEAVGQLLREARRPRRPTSPPETVRTRIAELTRRGREIANQFAALYNSSRSERDREFILESAIELRLILMQPWD